MQKYGRDEGPCMENNRITFSISSVLYLMLSLTLLIDSLNGLFPNFHIGEIFRITLFSICSSQLLKYNLKLGMMLISIIIFLLFNISLSTLFTHNFNLVQDIAVAVKSMIIFMVSSTLILLYKKNKLSFSIGDVLYNNLLYGPFLLMLASIFGLGATSYAWDNSSVGSKGTFMSLNSINVALAILFMYTIYNIIYSKDKLKWSLLSVYVGIPMVFLGTKTSLLIIIVAPVMFVLLSRNRKYLVKGLIGLLVLVGVGLLFQSRIVDSIEPIIMRQLYLMEQRDLSTYLFSTRNTRVMNIIELYLSQFSVYDLFPGKGYSISHYLYGMNDGSLVLPIEMDFIDIIVSYGFIGILYTYIYVINILYRCKSQWDKDGQFFFWSALIVFAYGSLAGHVFLEAISSTFFSLLLAGLYICNLLYSECRNTSNRNINI